MCLPLTYEAFHPTHFCERAWKRKIRSNGKKWQACPTSNNGNVYIVCVIFHPFIVSLLRAYLLEIFIFYRMSGGSLKFFLREGWFCIKCHFFHKNMFEVMY